MTVSLCLPPLAADLQQRLDAIGGHVLRVLPGIMPGDDSIYELQLPFHGLRTLFTAESYITERIGAWEAAAALLADDFAPETWGETAATNSQPDYPSPDEQPPELHERAPSGYQTGADEPEDQALAELLRRMRCSHSLSDLQTFGMHVPELIFAIYAARSRAVVAEQTVADLRQQLREVETESRSRLRALAALALEHLGEIQIKQRYLDALPEDAGIEVWWGWETHDLQIRVDVPFDGTRVIVSKGTPFERRGVIVHQLANLSNWYRIRLDDGRETEHSRNSLTRELP